jgi:hypothetical protein
MLNPAGGLRYHWRAQRHARRWRTFTGPLAAWLADWETTATRLLLVGPSAGWCLPDALFLRFREIDVLEPDPLARLLLRRRLRALDVRAQVHERDYLTGDRVERLGDDFPEHAVAFCNVLGQLRFLRGDLDDPARDRAWKASLMRTLEGREWLTFHDRLSGLIAPRIARSVDDSSDDGLAAAFYEGEGELTSHGTDGLFPHMPRRYFVWELLPGQHHLIEAIRHA